MYDAFAKIRTITKTQTNVRLVLADPDSKALELTRVVNVILDGTMEVFTTEPFKTMDAGPIYVLPWYIGEMPSRGRSAIGEIAMAGNPDLTTTGVIRQNVHGYAFPATLEAAVYQVFEIPGYSRLHNKFPVMIEAQVDAVPPFFAVAKCSAGAILFDDKNTPRGFVGGRSLTLLGPA